MNLSNLAAWAVDHIFGAGTAEHFGADIASAVSSLIAANPSLSQQAVTAKIEADAAELIQSCLGIKNTFAVYLLDALLDDEIGNIVAAAYAKIGAG
jgi:hypothetical protein